MPYPYPGHIWVNDSLATPLSAERLADIDAAAMEAVNRLVINGANPNVARPAVDGPAIWVGTVEPVNADDTRNDVVLLAGGSGGGGSVSGISDVPGLQGELDSKADRQLTRVTVTGDYTVAAGDLTGFTILHCTATGPTTITLPALSTLDVPLYWRQYGTGQMTFTSGTGATVVARGAAFKSAGQYAEGVTTITAASTWLLSGDIST